jgi:hypothetical protein
MMILTNVTLVLYFLHTNYYYFPGHHEICDDVAVDLDPATITPQLTEGILAGSGANRQVVTP